MKESEGRKEVKKQQSILARTWNFLWKSDSFLSWVVDLVLLYIFVKFIFFPLLGLIFATSLPSVIVESESMYHSGNFEAWWQQFGQWYIQNNITKEQAEKWIFKNGIAKGDIIVLVGSRSGSYNLSIGEVIIFDAKQRIPIIHRVVSINPIETKGDNNNGQLSFEQSINQQQIIGRAAFKIPKLGWTKLIFVEIFKAFQR